MRTSEVVRPLLILLLEHVAFFHKSSVGPGNTRLLHNASVLEESSHSNGDAEKEEEVQCDQGGKVDGARHDRHTAAGAENSHSQGIAERLEAQTNAGKIAFGRMNVDRGASPGF